jgi:hypothetical protein
MNDLGFENMYFVVFFLFLSINVKCISSVNL